MSSRPQRKKANLHPGHIVRATTRPRRTAAQMAEARQAAAFEAQQLEANRVSAESRIEELTAASAEQARAESARSSQPIDVSQLIPVKVVRQPATSRKISVAAKQAASKNVSPESMAVDENSSVRCVHIIASNAHISVDVLSASCYFRCCAFN